MPAIRIPDTVRWIGRRLSTTSSHLRRGCLRRFTRLALALFRRSVTTGDPGNPERRRALQAVHWPVTYAVYAARTLLGSAVVGITGGLLALGFVQHIRSEHLRDGSTPGWLESLVATGLVPVPEGLSSAALFVGLSLFSAGSIGVGSAWLVYAWRWRRVQRIARKRGKQIDASLPRTIAFLYALSRSGMPVAGAMRTVAANRSTLGASADEIRVLVAAMDRFGVDLNSALARAAHRTPSEPFGDFLENVRNVLQSGRTVPDYLRERYEQHREERVHDQEHVLELLNALAEAYVAGLVAGPLFVITILVVAGLLVGGVLRLLQLVVYVALPLATGGFVLYLGRVAAPLSPVGGRLAHEPAAGHEPPGRRSWNPLETVSRTPSTVCYLSGPVGLLYLLGRGMPVLVGSAGPTAVALDDLLVQTGLIVAAPYAAARLLYTRRLRRIEAPIPDLLERLASTNEAGMTVTESFRRVDQSDLGAIDEEVRRLLADIYWGARTEAALRRFSTRVGAPSVARVTALITNAMRASGHLSPVLRIAADEARARRRLQRTRRQEMLLYVIIIYLAFGVFLAIAAALQTVLIPAIPGDQTIGSIARSGARVGVELPGTRSSAAARGAYTRVLFHAVLIQSTLSGFVAGQMGEGNLLDGTKHSVVMGSIGYGVFVFLG